MIETNNIPQHIAIIMDGNGRWANERGKERSYGHQAGVEAVRRITSECTRLGVKYLTLYCRRDCCPDGTGAHFAGRRDIYEE